MSKEKEKITMHFMGKINVKSFKTTNQEKVMLHTQTILQHFYKLPM